MPRTGANLPSQQTIIIKATATDTQHAFHSKTDYATTGCEALWTLSNGCVHPNEFHEQFKIGSVAISNKYIIIMHVF